jgi:ABC-2 type transport system ATP-binding protein
MRAVDARGISKGFRSMLRRKDVLFDITLSIDEGEIFGILGPNGAGKTTLIAIFSTLIYPDKGSLHIFGRDALHDAESIRSLINISSGNPNFPWSLTVRENLRHSAMLYGLYGRELKRSVDDAMALFELEPHDDTRFENLSTGLKQRVSLAKSMLNSPRLLFLDEPTTGLDLDMAMKTRSMIRRIHEEQGITVVLSTHHMQEADDLCDRIAFLRSGRLIALGTPKDLKQHLKLGNRVLIRYRGTVNLQELEKIPGVLDVQASEGQLEIFLSRAGNAVSGIFKLFEEADILDVRMEQPDLEDVFLELAR